MKKVFPWILLFALLLAIGYSMSRGGSPAARVDNPDAGEEALAINITLSEDLKEYMLQQGYEDIIVEAEICRT